MDIQTSINKFNSVFNIKSESDIEKISESYRKDRINDIRSNKVSLITDHSKWNTNWNKEYIRQNHLIKNQ